VCESMNKKQIEKYYVNEEVTLLNVAWDEVVSTISSHQQGLDALIVSP